jgi:hypothetical protein
VEGLKRHAQQKLQCKKGEYGRVQTMPFREESVKGELKINAHHGFENICPAAITV